MRSSAVAAATALQSVVDCVCPMLLWLHGAWNAILLRGCNPQILFALMWRCLLGIRKLLLKGDSLQVPDPAWRETIMFSEVKGCVGASGGPIGAYHGR